MRKPSLTTQILLGLIAGIVIGHFAPAFGVKLQFLGDLFLHLIKMIVVPLIFSSLVMGIAGSGDFKHVGRIGAKTMIWFTITTVVALVVALGLANLVQPGVGVDMAAIVKDGASTAASASGKAGEIDWAKFLVGLVPTNIVDSMARGDTLQIVVFATFFGVATAAAAEKGKPVLDLAHSVAEVMFKVTETVMILAPVGILAASAVTVSKYGLAVLLPLAKLVLTTYLALAVFGAIILVAVCKYVGLPLVAFFRHILETFLLAFSTASSEAALPQAMTKMETAGVPRSIVTFVLPTGYSFNLDGSTLYLAMASLFIAQVYGIDLSWTQQLAMMATLMIASNGVAAVPGASLVVLAATLTAFNLPLEGIALILGVDRLLDMARTSVNLLGNCLATAVVAKWENAFDPQVMQRTLLGAPAETEPVPAGVAD